MEITLLGTTSAIPTKFRNHSAIALKAFGEVMLFDCGEGTQRQLNFAKISPMKISKIFISHFHGDHILGLGGLINSMGFRGRNSKLDIYGPKGLEKLIDSILKVAYTTVDFPLEIHEISEGILIENEEYLITSAKGKHNLLNYGYSVEEKKKPRFNREKAIELGVEVGPDFGKLQNGEEVTVNGKVIKPEYVLGSPRKGKKFTYSGDTMACESMINLAKDSDLLIHESTYTNEDELKALENKHSTSSQAASIAKQANVDKLVLTHISPRYTNTKQLEKEAREVFENTIIGKDYLTIEL